MTRKRYRQMPDLSLVEITDDDYMPSTKGDASLWNDRHYDGLKTTDGHDISSRSKHRQYAKHTGLVDFDDYKETFAKRQAERDAYHSGKRGSISRHDIDYAIHQLKNR